MLLIKNDPKYNESGRAPSSPTSASTASTSRERLAPLANDGKLSPHLPEGTPFGLVGTSSLYKRESYPDGGVPRDGVTAAYAGGRDRTAASAVRTRSTPRRTAPRSTGSTRAATPGRTRNDDIHAIRILVHGADDRPQPRPQVRPAVPTTTPTNGCASSAKSRCANSTGDKQPLDPDGNPDTSFLAKIPADTAFTFQTLDKDGMVLNMAQTWHQLRPGEIRNDCGGCHAHSQKPTPFELTAAAKPNYEVFDLTRRTPLLTTKAQRRVRQEVGRQGRDGPALRRRGCKNVEYLPRREADPRPQLRRLPHAQGRQAGRQPGAGRRRPDAFRQRAGKVPGTYFRLALDTEAKFGLQAGHPQRPVAADQRLALHPHVPVAPQPADLENLRPAHRRLEQRRFPDGNRPRRRQHAALGTASRCRTRRRTATAPTSIYTGSADAAAGSRGRHLRRPGRQERSRCRR